MNKIIHRLNAEDVQVLRDVVDATRQDSLSRSDYDAARRWHDLRDKLDATLNTILQAGGSIPSRS